jgi:serine protease
MVNGHEFAETVTDQEPGYGWYNRQASSPYGGEEDADECAWLSSGSGAAADVAMGDGAFAMQSTWSNDTNSCAISHPVVTGSSGAHTVTVTNPGNQSTARYSSVSLSVHATDSVSGSALTWSASGLPSGLRINPTTGVISGTTSSTIRTYSVTVKAADPTGASGTASFSWSVHR